MYFLYIRDGIADGEGFYRLAGIFEPSNYWTNACNMAEAMYGFENVTYRFHQRA